MKKVLIPLLSLLLCFGGIGLGVALIFVRYKATREQDARAAAALQASHGDFNLATQVLTGRASSVQFGAHMPAEIGNTTTGSSAHPAASPAPATPAPQP